MRLPIQRKLDGSMYITIDYDQTPKGFEDAFEDSNFRRKLLIGQSFGEYNAPDVTALMGNESAVIYRMRGLDESRLCMWVGNALHFANRYLQLEIKPFGRLGQVFKMTVDANPPEDQYVTFRLDTEQDEEGEEVIKNIFNLDYTPVQYGPHNTKLI